MVGLEHYTTGTGAGFLACASVVAVLASCVPAPQTQDEAYALAGHKRSAKFAQCSRVQSDYPFGGSWTKPTVDMGDGMIAVDTEWGGETGSGRVVDVVDCSTGLGVRMNEALVARSVSDSAFKSPAELALLRYAASAEPKDLLTIGGKAIADGLKPKPWKHWANSGSEEAECACKLYYPALKQHWFDKRKVGPGYDEKFGDAPNTFEELKEQIVTLSAVQN